MWHPIAFVAESRHLDKDALEHFASENQQKYSIVNEFGHQEVNTWHVDQLVADFKSANRPSVE